MPSWIAILAWLKLIRLHRLIELFTKHMEYNLKVQIGGHGYTDSKHRTGRRYMTKAGREEGAICFRSCKGHLLGLSSVAWEHVVRRLYSRYH
jgi:hypothetical protein